MLSLKACRLVPACAPAPLTTRCGSRTRYGTATFGSAKTAGAQIIEGFGAQPISEHYADNFEAKRKEHQADQFQVNDC